MQRLIVAGIHTEVGKTVVSAILTKMTDGSYWKPIQCGAPADAEWIEQVTGLYAYPSSFFFQTPCSPHLAARQEAIEIDLHHLQPPQHTNTLIIEGTGGIYAPLNRTNTWADAAVQWQAGWILVHRHYLGSLNHFLLTVEALNRRNIPLLGVVFNGQGDAATEKMLLQKAACPLVERLSFENQLTRQRIAEIATTWRESWKTVLGL